MDAATFHRLFIISLALKPIETKRGLIIRVRSQCYVYSVIDVPETFFQAVFRSRLDISISVTVREKKKTFQLEALVKVKKKIFLKTSPFVLPGSRDSFV